MFKQTTTPNYIKIAIDIAHRIVNNHFTEGEKITGRTTLVSIYNVSPETIRRSLALLKDMDVVTINEKSGVIINNKYNAREFLNKFKTKSEFTNLNSETFALIKQRKEIDDKLEKNINDIIEFATQLRNVGSIIPFESIVEKDSLAVGKTIGDLNFWHNTKATIIAVKRDGNLFLSPGPYFKIDERDVIVYVGDDSVFETVKNYISLPLNKN